MNSLPINLWFRLVWVMGLCCATVGCESSPARFTLNSVYARKQEDTVGEEMLPQQVQDVANALTALFGTPDEPYIVVDAGLGLDQILDSRNLQMAAGPVGRDETARPHGLYREHCAHCHGISGDGAGPTSAFLNPYPRDYRRGIFKFKSTPKGARPTHQDLRRILVNGVPGTAMPSFRLLPDGEIDALVDYVIYLSMRGEVERALLEDSSELDAADGERLDVSRDNLIDNKLARVIRMWKAAESQVTPVPARPEMDLAASAHRGRELYFGAIANCVKCHGDTQLGDGQTNDYDDWTKEFVDWGKVTDDHERSQKEAAFIALGGLAPRNIRPRNLRQGIYRGGRRPVDLFWRVKNGIDGSPMPAAMMKPEGAPDAKGLTTDDIWHIVDYVRTLPYEPLSQPQIPAPAYQRERL